MYDNEDSSKQAGMRSVSVVIPTYNGLQLLKETLPFTIKALRNIEDHEIIIVDDCSQDNTVAVISGDFPFVKIFANDSNLGFARTANHGMREATKDLVLFLNNDIKLSEDYFEDQLDCFQDDQVFGIMGMIKDEKTNIVLEGCKRPFMSLTEIHYEDVVFDNFNNKERLPTLYLSGGNALVFRKKLIELGGFSFLYEPFYYEDVDLSVRALLKGWKLLFQPASICLHKHSATIGKIFKKDEIWIASRRNRLIFNAVYLHGYRRQLFWILVSLKYVFYMLTRFVNNGNRFKAYSRFFNLRKEINAYRDKLNPEKLHELPAVISAINLEIRRHLSSS